jgi:hypothetical protein
MKLTKQHRSWWLLGPLLAAGAGAQAAQYTPANLGLDSGWGASWGGPNLDNIIPFESTAYARVNRTKSGSTYTYTIDASTKASNVPGVGGANKTLTWWADATHAFTVTGASSYWDLNFTGTSSSPTGSANCTGTCNVSVWGTGISGTVANMTWLQSWSPGIYSAFTSSSSQRNLFSATITAMDAFGEGDANTVDAIAFRWQTPTGSLAPFADLLNYAYLGNLNLNSLNAASSSVTISTTNAIQHTNVPLPAAVYLLGSALFFLRRKAVEAQFASA